MARPPASKQLFIVLGDQLFPRRHLSAYSDAVFFLAEDYELCTRVRHHKHKIILFLSAMRGYAGELADAGRNVIYKRLDEAPPDLRYEDKLDETLARTGATEVVHFEVEDAFMEERLRDWAAAHGLTRVVLPSPAFLNSRDDFARFASGKSRLLMADFYRQTRQSTGFLMEDGEPVGGRYSLDAENRKPLPSNVAVPAGPAVRPTAEVREVMDLVQEKFPEHPGESGNFWLATRRSAALKWLRQFLDERFALFGDYEDAMSERSATVFHSVLSPLLNLGLITPREVVQRALKHAAEKQIPLNSVEGFLRQMIGWREFVRGVYHEHGDRQLAGNFFGHQRRLTAHWYRATTGIDPLDHVIEATRTRGWAHHIERLMIAGNLMTLAEIHPDDAYRWFMEMFVDSADWVMVPNVYGMALFADGGLFATKPYICGSNYLLKMSDFRRGPWCDVVDGLYWRFVDKHRDFFSANHRLSMMPRAFDRLDATRRERIITTADRFIEDFTGPPQD